MNRIDVWPIAFKDAIRDVDDRVYAAKTQIAGQQSRGGRTVDVIVAKNGYVFTANHRIGNARGRDLHARNDMWIGQKAPDGGVEKFLDFINLDISPGQNPGK